MRADISRLLSLYLNSIPAGLEADFGFHSRDEIALSEPGRPFAMFKLEKGYGFTFMNYWRLPLLIAGEARSILDVGKGPTGYFVAGFGSAVFAPLLQKRAIELGISIKGPANNAAILRTYVPLKGPHNDYLVCPERRNGAQPLEDVHALPFHPSAPSGTRPAPSAGTSSPARCLSAAEILAQVPLD